jgi:hypothetical protein
MASNQIVFDVEKAQVLSISLNDFNESWKEWSVVEKCWANLQLTWRDQQYDKFEPLFEALTDSYSKASQSCDNCKRFILSQIEIAAESRGNLLRSVDDSKSNPSSSSASTDQALFKGNIGSSNQHQPSKTGDILDEISHLKDSFYALMKSTVSLTMVGSSMFLSVVAGTNTRNLPLFFRYVEIVMELSKGLVELSNKTIGSDISPLPDDSIPKIISNAYEEAEESVFGDEDIQEFVDIYAEDTIEKAKKSRRKRRDVSQD